MKRSSSSKRGIKNSSASKKSILSESFDELLGELKHDSRMYKIFQMQI